MGLTYQFLSRRLFYVLKRPVIETVSEKSGEFQRIVSGEGVSPFLSPRRLRAKYTLRTKLRFVLRGFRPCSGQICAGANLQSERAGLYFPCALKDGMHGRRCFQWFHFGENVKPRQRDFAEVPLRLPESGIRDLSGYGHRFAVSRPMAAAHRESGGIGLSARGKEKRL